MKNRFRQIISILFLVVFIACNNKKNKDLISIDDVFPWCIVDFDALDRTPEQRIVMLKQMGFTKYGYDRVKGDLSRMKDEFRLAKENNIEITSVFLWLNAKRDTIGKLSPSNRELLTNLAEIENKTTIWLSFSSNFFEGLNQEQSMELSIAMIEFVKSEADKTGCKLALYNHHGWFGNPHNQVDILERLKTDSITMVFNFHHAHSYIDEFRVIAKKIKPYLSCVNLNGVKSGGPKILTIGEGDHEVEMINNLIDAGFKGPWGILGHIKTEDVQKVLTRNMDGLKLINSELN